MPLLLILAGAGLAAQPGDVVNERPPTNRSAIERHWGLDCPAVVATLDSLLTRAAGLARHDQATRLDEVMASLETCALLDRRHPGEEDRFLRVYRAARGWRDALKEGSWARCEAARRKLKSTLEQAFDLSQG